MHWKRNYTKVVSSMANEKQINKKLEGLNEEIIWNNERQQQVRRRLIRGMEHDKGPPVSWIKRRFIPVFSLLLLVTIVTTIFLSEFSGNKVADKGTNPTHNNGDSPSQLIDDNDDNNE